MITKTVNYEPSDSLFTVVPSICRIDHDVTGTNTASGKNAYSITPNPVPNAGSGKALVFFYDSDVIPAENNESQVITIASTARSRYNDSGSTKTSSNSFNLFFSNPCATFDEITISSNTQPADPSPTYGGSVSWNYAPATVLPSVCSTKTTKTCEQVIPDNENGFDCLPIVNNVVDFSLTEQQYTTDVLAN